MYLRDVCFQNSIYCINAILFQAFQLGEFPVSRWSWVEINGREWGSQPTAKFPGWLLCHSLNEPFDWLRLQDSTVISWGELSDRCLRITLIGTSCLKTAAFQFLCGCLCATRYLAGVGISSLIAYILNLLSLPIFVLRGNYSWKFVCNMRSSIFSSFHFRQILPRKKQINKRRQIWEIQICSYILILGLSKCLLVDNPKFSPCQNKYSKDAAPNN